MGQNMVGRERNLKGDITTQTKMTDFTIDCILSKSDKHETSSMPANHPVTLNKVLNNNPWIPISPLTHFFNPCLHKKYPLPNLFCPSPSSQIVGTNIIENLRRVTESHAQSINNFYASTHVLALESSNAVANKSIVYEKIFCDTHSESHKNIQSDLTNKNQPLSEIKCTTCLKSFDNIESLDIHMKSHVMKPKHSCPHCEKQFSQLRNFKYHLSIHNGTKEFAASCPECGKIFNDKGYLSSHLKIHRNKKEHQCSYCPKSFNQRVAFNMHVRIHLGLKPHSCQDCGKTFSRKMLLKQHQRTHSGEKPYKCSFEGCEKRFADRSNMILHFRLHSGIKPFACNLCPKRFSKKHHLGTHLNYHLNLKPYACLNENCTQKFTQSSNMRTHMKKCPHRKTREQQ